MSGVGLEVCHTRLSVPSCVLDAWTSSLQWLQTPAEICRLASVAPCASCLFVSTAWPCGTIQCPSMCNQDDWQLGLHKCQFGRFGCQKVLFRASHAPHADGTQWHEGSEGLTTVGPWERFEGPVAKPEGPRVMRKGQCCPCTPKPIIFTHGKDIITHDDYLCVCNGGQDPHADSESSRLLRPPTTSGHEHFCQTFINARRALHGQETGPDLAGSVDRAAHGSLGPGGGCAGLDCWSTSRGRQA